MLKYSLLNDIFNAGILLGGKSMEPFIILAVIPVLVSAISIVLTQKEKRKRIIFYNVIIYGLAAILLLLIMIYNAQTRRDDNRYSKYGTSLFGGWNYDSEDNDFYYLTNYVFMSSEKYAVLKDGCQLSPVVKIVKSSIVYTEKGAEIQVGGEEVENDGRYYTICNSIIKIVPDFTDIFITSEAVLYIILILGNLVLVIWSIVRKRLKKEKAEE